MIAFRAILNTLKTSQASTSDLSKLQRQILPDYEPQDIPSFKSYCYFEPRDLYSDYLEEEAVKGKGAFIQAIYGLSLTKPDYTIWQTNLGNHRVPKLSPSGLYWLKRCWMGVMDRNGPISYFECQAHVHLSEYNAQTRKDAFWLQISKQLPRATPEL
ncbi:hypothetical protein TNIN_261841 [Trichonephila inaurata madagascariensis]|uniref:Uncharacterized protein n=1 Tax=Trichonephila inaurata madagascariensis TaxID=2747483 RepID=A0A8X6WXB6_9ARAC|nr:hypothetical protein TNIN_261841 [Trichonephila inaurata madagascariensis]